jgi:hypothetical protein
MQLGPDAKVVGWHSRAHGCDERTRKFQRIMMRRCFYLADLK